jgi:hypothetical protein
MSQEWFVRMKHTEYMREDITKSTATNAIRDRRVARATQQGTHEGMIDHVTAVRMLQKLFLRPTSYSMQHKAANSLHALRGECL